MNRPQVTILAEAMAKARSRSSWNDRLAHWERPASDHEETKILRAATMAREVVNGNSWLSAEEVTVVPQGSYFNNTNVRLEADMDLRAQHPSILIRYAPEVSAEQAYADLGYFSTGRTFWSLVTDMRAQLAGDLGKRFGRGNVTVGTKAITVAGLDGSRADCDVVPAFRLHWVQRTSLGVLSRHFEVEGVAILGSDGSWTFNFPQQHHANGKGKRERTRHRFKKVVRMLKQMNYELVEIGTLHQKLPSFLIECLVHTVEDEYFLQQDDRYGRLVRVVRRLAQLIESPLWTMTATEINGIKPLFSGQPWTVDQVKAFIRAALRRLEV